ncbi:MAG: flagellar export chaperone FlgN [Nitrospira sp.]|nr:flagellar export chaperone FlgN [bacterium]MBL7048042.1 flagellar export chaperone FlgN [Nitrospira sp.]
MSTEIAIENILLEQIKAYKILDQLLKQERECLIRIDAETVEQLSKEKDTVLMRLRLLEEERQRLTSIFVQDNGIDGEVNLAIISQITGNDGLISLRSKLLSLLQSIDEMNKFNAILIERSINYVKVNTTFLNRFISDKSPRQKGALLSKET